MGATPTEQRALRPDAQAFDEVRIVTVPRYKTSGLSGDEWRISARLQFMRKGRIMHERTLGSVEMACVFAASEYHTAVDAGGGYFAGEGDFCDQEGCAEKATVTYRVKTRFCRDHPHEHQEPMDASRFGSPVVTVRKFCERHSRRGDCAFDDADDNYELLSGAAKSPEAADVRPSGFAGVVTLTAQQPAADV